MTRKNHDNYLKRPTDSYSATLKEYRSLALRPELTEIEAKRLEHILEVACADDMLSLLLNEVDEALFDAQERSEHHNYHEIQNEAARTVELIGGKIPCHKKVFANAKLNLAAYEPTLKEYSELLQASTLSQADATHMEQILETAYEDELLALLLDNIDAHLVEIQTVDKPKQTKQKRIPRRKRSATSVIESALIACSLLLAAAPLAMNLQPQTSPSQEQLTSSNNFFVDQPSVSEFNFETSNISPGKEETLAQMTPQSSAENDALEEEIISPNVTDNSLSLDTGDLFSPEIEFDVKLIEPDPRESLPPQKAITDTDIAINLPALEAIKEDTEDDFIMPSYDLPTMEPIENENSEEALDNHLPEPIRPTTNEEPGPSNINWDFHDAPNNNAKIEIAGESIAPDASLGHNYPQLGIAARSAALHPHVLMEPNSEETVEDESVDRTANIISTNNHSIAPIYGTSGLGADETAIVASGEATIEGGAVIGMNLFHSFRGFSISDDHQVYFAHPDGVESILNRVTGIHPSQIANLMGLDRTANLFFLNPTGIVFGPNAPQLDIRGGFTASSLDRLAFQRVEIFLDRNPETQVFKDNSGSIVVNSSSGNVSSLITEGDIRITTSVMAVPNDSGNILETSTSGDGGQISLEGNRIFDIAPRHNISTPNSSSLSIAELRQTSRPSRASISVVSGLSDVLPSDWAYTGLQSLVEEYGCLEGYPNSSYRAMTRYEFAAGLNACLDVIAHLSAPDIRSDLDTIHRLQEEFSAELATIRGRVDTLVANVAELEANQFSTTKLKGQLDAHLVVPFNAPDANDAPTFEYRTHLNFDTSFIGEDRLRIRLQAGDANNSLPEVADGLASQSGARNELEDNVGLDDVYYSFPVGSHISTIVSENSRDASWQTDSTASDFLGTGNAAGIYYVEEFDNNEVAEEYYSIKINTYWPLTPSVLYGEFDVEGDDIIYGIIRSTFRF
ncbi:iron uptake porin [Leptolyngbya cf. ectocarpi LEGE 11479]|uniref:Iron uptake porin n=1 Tax=Leptolyngbya cf. ectocarpi LEGE 11479 TaxID=1828722 RepID=A0A928ZW95_LEPEC|nr:iron uptake porin [Leptolyngbya ectocarpi]MBE9068611.1 iron uptake porin [Leptolyngbya cf. ectocarpi LEGE 11479]